MADLETLSNPDNVNLIHFSLLIARNFGVQVTRVNVTDWDVSLGAGNVMDMILDGTDDPNIGRSYHKQLSEIIGAGDYTYFSPGNTELDERLADAAGSEDPVDIYRSRRRLSSYAIRFSSWSDDQKQCHLTGWDGMRTESANKKTAATAKDLVEIRTREAKYANMLGRIFPETDASRRFQKYLDIVVPQACIWDDAWDLGVDAANGDHMVPPTLMNRIFLLRESMRNFPDFIKPIKASTSCMAGKLAISVVRNRYLRPQILPLGSER
ncbi:MAG: hypothetical protein ACRD4B_10920 [Acidobacteriota bacterium]